VPVHLTAVTADGRKLIDEEVITLPNGFVDLWLPRDNQIDVTIEKADLESTVRIGTFDADNTCNTTFKLHY
jgi:hypothetical protein